RDDRARLLALALHVLLSRPMTALAADGRQRRAARGEAGRLLESRGVTAQTVRVLRLVLVLDRGERFRVPRAVPELVLLRVTVGAGGGADELTRVEERALALGALLGQRAPLFERQVRERSHARGVRHERQPFAEHEAQRVLAVVTAQAHRLEAGLGELG